MVPVLLNAKFMEGLSTGDKVTSIKMCKTHFTAIGYGTWTCSKFEFSVTYYIIGAIPRTEVPNICNM